MAAVLWGLKEEVSAVGRTKEMTLIGQNRRIALSLLYSSQHSIPISLSLFLIQLFINGFGCGLILICINQNVCYPSILHEFLVLSKGVLDNTSIGYVVAKRVMQFPTRQWLPICHTIKGILRVSLDHHISQSLAFQCLGFFSGQV